MSEKTLLMALDHLNDGLYNGTVESLHGNLVEIGGLLKLSTQDDEFRKTVATEMVWTELVGVLSWNIIEEPLDSLSLKLRCLRGVLLICRNLAIIDNIVPLSLRISDQLFGKLAQLNILDKSLEALYSPLILAIWQLFSNLTTVENKIVEDVNLLAGISSHLNEVSSEVALPFYLFVNNIVRNTDICYDLLNNYGDIVNFLYEQSNDIDTHEMTELCLIKINLWQKLACHESFGKYLFKLQEEEFRAYLIFVQMIIVSKDNWDNYQLTAILSYVMDLLTRYSEASTELLNAKIYDPEELKVVNKDLIIVLDILSDLSKFETTKGFLVHYKAVELLVSLLGCIEVNTESKTLKKEIDSTKRIFPHVKSILIEILSFLIYKNKEIQDSMRELHGLELILNNCKIDDYNPYIKERSIIALKFLLENNPENQGFVSKLEAKEVIKDEVLQEAGYEVEIVDGKVKMKENERIKSKKEQIKREKVETIEEIDEE